MQSSLPPELIWTDDNNSIFLNNWEWLISLYSYGIYRYNDVTGVYYHTETGIKANKINFLEANNGKLFTRTSIGPNGLYSSTNAGNTFSPMPDFIKLGAPLKFKGDTILTTSTGYNLCMSYDNGNSWDSIVSTGPYFHPYYFLTCNDGRIFSYDTYNISVSNDWGQTWDSIGIVYDSICSINPNSKHIDGATIFNNQLFIADGSNKLISKLDTATSTFKWKTCINSPGAGFVSLETIEDVLVFSSNSQFLISIDTGNTWYSPARLGYPSGKRIRSLTAINGVWYSPCNGNIYYSLDRGNNWQQLTTNVGMFVYENNWEKVITQLNSILYAGGNNIWMNNDTLQLISGNVYFDNNNNGIKDAGEQGIPNIVLHTTPYNIAYTTDSLGNYSFLTATVGDTLKPNLPTTFCSSNPPYYLTNGSATNANFGIYFYPGIQDLSVDITNRCPFRPFFNTLIDVDIKNKGTVLMQSQLEVVLDTSLIYVNASVSPTQINGDTLTFSIDTIPLLQSERITIETQTGFAVPITTPIICQATISPIAGDTVPADNI